MRTYLNIRSQQQDFLFRCKQCVIQSVSLPCPNIRDRTCAFVNSGVVHEFEDNNQVYSSMVCNQNQENGLELALKDARLNRAHTTQTGGRIDNPFTTKRKW